MQSQKICQGGDILKTFIVNNIFHIGSYRPFLSSNLTQGVQMLLNSARGVVPVFLEKHITTCDFQGDPDPLRIHPCIKSAV